MIFKYLFLLINNNDYWLFQSLPIGNSIRLSFVCLIIYYNCFFPPHVVFLYSVFYIRKFRNYFRNLFLDNFWLLDKQWKWHVSQLVRKVLLHINDLLLSRDAAGFRLNARRRPRRRGCALNRQHSQAASPSYQSHGLAAARRTRAHCLCGTPPPHRDKVLSLSRAALIYIREQVRAPRF